MSRTFELDGETFEEHVLVIDRCKGCYFSNATKKCQKAPFCSSKDREDGRDVIFKKVKNGRKN